MFCNFSRKEFSFKAQINSHNVVVVFAKLFFFDKIWLFDVSKPFSPFFFIIINAKTFLFASDKNFRILETRDKHSNFFVLISLQNIKHLKPIPQIALQIEISLHEQQVKHEFEQKKLNYVYVIIVIKIQENEKKKTIMTVDFPYT